MTCDELLDILRAEGNPANVAGMARYGSNTASALGVSIPFLRRLAKRVGTDHRLAGRLWKSGIHEARILAALVDDPARVTEAQMERWVRQIDSWDVCDLTCGNLFDRTAHAWTKVHQWPHRRGELVKRAGFALMAALAVHDKATDDAAFEALLPLVEQESDDERNFVKKAANWALRQIGKRNCRLNAASVATAERIGQRGTRPARWIARDALRELRSEKVLARLKRQGRRTRGSERPVGIIGPLA